MSEIEQHWYNTEKKPPFHLRILSWVFALVAMLRRLAFRILFFLVHRPKVPVIVVGNITVGGSGKTPMVTWLVKTLKAAGLNPGIVSRGYGGNATAWPQQVRPDSDPAVVGDEAVLLARHCICPMAVAPKRVQAVKALLKAHPEIDILISDDGLQHYALGRHMEIVVIDGDRRHGNGYLLPAGPLREPVSRLRSVDYVVNNGGEPGSDEYSMQLVMGKLISVQNCRKQAALSSLSGQAVHALAGIGNPQRFFQQLQQQGLGKIECHEFPDHYQFKPGDILFKDEKKVLMTEKDAVKCERFANETHWYVSVEAVLDDKFRQSLLADVEKLVARRKKGWTVNYSTS